MSQDKYTKSYDDLIEHLYEAMGDTLHGIGEAMEQAKEKISALGVHTQSEINHIADNLQRDLKLAASGTPDSSPDSLSQWLKFDVALIENFALKNFFEIADKTRVKLTELELDAKQYHPYHSGDVACPGAFVCDGCGKHIAFKSTSVIPHCPECHGESFSRC